MTAFKILEGLSQRRKFLSKHNGYLWSSQKYFSELWEKQPVRI